MPDVKETVRATRTSWYMSSLCPTRGTKPRHWHNSDQKTNAYPRVVSGGVLAGTQVSAVVAGKGDYT